jgi:hypothetical protein
VIPRTPTRVFGVVPQMMRRVVLTFACLFALIAPISGAVASEQRQPSDQCTWGASSVTAELENGEWVESQPQTSGCVRRP